jgi:hypothetical protein
MMSALQVFSTRGRLLDGAMSPIVEEWVDDQLSRQRAVLVIHGVVPARRDGTADTAADAEIDEVGSAMARAGDRAAARRRR